MADHKTKLNRAARFVALVPSLCLAIGLFAQSPTVSEEYVRLGGRILAIEAGSSSDGTITVSPANPTMCAGQNSGYFASGLTPVANLYNAANNRFSSTDSNFSYDNNGNQTLVSPFTIGYDAENRQTSINSTMHGSATYSYDGDGRRVQKAITGGATMIYVYDAKGELAAEYSTQPPTMPCATCYLSTDHLGSTRLMADQNGNAVSRHDFLPFGEELVTNNRTSGLGYGVSDYVNQKFTSKERDAESGLDFVKARYFSGAQGRFTRPDWSAAPQPLPYAKLEDPQSLNLYGYVRNNPLSRTDPDGHADIAAECKGQASCSKTVTQTVGIYHYDKNTGKSVLDATLSVATKFNLTTDSKGNVSVSASSTVANVSGHAYSASQLTTMGKDIGAIQQSAVMMGFGQNTTQLITAVGANETAFGAAAALEKSPFKAPEINPLQLSGGRANGDLMHNIQGALGVFDYFGSKVDFDPVPTYRGYSDKSVPPMSNFTAVWGSLTEKEQ